MSGRQKIFTDQVLVEIEALVAQGVDKHTIASRIGCTLGSLQVMCCRHRISLRHPGDPRRRRRLAGVLGISEQAMARLRQRAALNGQTATKLAAELLELIATDDLWDAVLDNS